MTYVSRKKPRPVQIRKTYLEDLKIQKLVFTIFLNTDVKATRGFSVYNIEKRTPLPHSTAYQLVKKAAQTTQGGIGANPLLEVVSEETTRAGLTSRRYFLTSWSLSWVFNRFPFLPSQNTRAYSLGRSVQQILEPVERKNANEWFLQLAKPEAKKRAIDRLDELAYKRPSLHPALKWWPAFRDTGNSTRTLFLSFIGGWGDDFPTFLYSAFSSLQHARDSSFHAPILREFQDEKQQESLKKEIMILFRRSPELQRIIRSNLKEEEAYYRKNLEDAINIRKALFAKNG